MGLVIIAAAFVMGRLMKMFRSTASMFRGLGLGMAVGVAAAVLASKAMDSDRHLRRSAQRAAHAVTGLMDDVGHAVSVKM